MSAVMCAIYELCALCFDSGVYVSLNFGVPLFLLYCAFSMEFRSLRFLASVIFYGILFFFFGCFRIPRASS